MLERFFHLKEHDTCLRNEILAGITTFLAAAYIIFVHPDMLAATGMDKGALTTVTCLVAGLSTLLMALWANVPIMLAPGMGLNAFFTYTLVINQNLPWQTALGIVFMSGIFFLILTWLGFRERVLKAIPASLQQATAVGIGLFIAFIGLQNLGLIIDNPATLVGLGPITRPALLGLIGLLLAILLEIRKVRGALLFSILTVTVLASSAAKPTCRKHWYPYRPPQPRSPSARHPRCPEPFFLGGHLHLHVHGPVRQPRHSASGVQEAGMVKEDGKIPGLPRMLTADALATVGGALLGTSTTTAFLESASGVSDGAAPD